jgi:hypothetical protein
MYPILKRMKVVTAIVTRGPKLPKEKVKPSALKVLNVKAKELKAKKMAKPVVAPKR